MPKKPMLQKLLRMFLPRTKMWKILWLQKLQKRQKRKKKKEHKFPPSKEESEKALWRINLIF